MDAQAYRTKIRADCALQGVELTRTRLLAGHYSQRKRPFVEEWIRETDARAGALSDADQREIDRSIARSSNRIALWVGGIANLVALAALAVAIIALGRP